MEKDKDGFKQNVSSALVHPAVVWGFSSVTSQTIRRTHTHTHTRVKTTRTKKTQKENPTARKISRRRISFHLFGPGILHFFLLHLAPAPHLPYACQRNPAVKMH